MADNIDIKDLEAEAAEDMMAEDIAEQEAAAGQPEETAEAETETEVKAETESEADEEASGEGTEKEKKSFFKKKEKKDKKDEKIDELNDRLMRTMAEFDNFRKRTEKEKAQMFEIGAKDIVEKILPVVDNFERGLAAVPEADKGGAFAQGMEMIYKQFIKCLEDAGVTVIEAVGKEFDPNLHNAVMHAEDEELGENIVSEEFQKGYKYRDSVVRHSMVKVVN